MVCVDLTWNDPFIALLWNNLYCNLYFTKSELHAKAVWNLYLMLFQV
jgi:hypothetical protein